MTMSERMIPEAAVRELIDRWEDEIFRSTPEEQNGLRHCIAETTALLATAAPQDELDAAARLISVADVSAGLKRLAGQDEAPEPEGLREAMQKIKRLTRAAVARKRDDDGDCRHTPWWQYLDLEEEADLHEAYRQTLARPAAAEGVDAGVIYAAPDAHGMTVLRFESGDEAAPDELWQHILESMPAEQDVVRIWLLPLTHQPDAGEEGV
jgi:hypothetical protein